jgi:hypothetical protein
MIAARVLVVLGGLLAVVSLLAGYIRYQALDNETVRATAGELIVDDEVRNQIATTLVDELYGNVDVEAALEQRLPPDQQGLAGLVAGGLREFADRSAVRMLERPRAQELWVDTVAFSHRQILNVLEDDTDSLSTEDGAVFLDLRPLIIQLGDRLPVVGRIAAQLPNESGRIKVMDAEQLETAQDVTRWLKAIGSWFWVVPLLLWAVALALARGRRLTILRAIAFTSIIVGLLVLVIRRLAGSYVVDSLVAAESVKPAAQDAWDILTQLLADGAWTLLGLGVVVLFAAWLAGAGRAATATRGALAPFLARWGIAYGVAAGLFLLLLLWAPTAQTTRGTAIVAGAALLALGVELLRRQVGREHPDAGDVELGAHMRAGLARVRSG